MILSDMITIIANISLVLSIVFFFFSLIQLIHQKKPLSHYFLAIIYFSVGVQCLSYWLYCRDSPLFETYFYYSDSAFLFLIGPFLYLFFIYISNFTPISFKKIFLHGAPFFITLILIEILNLYYPKMAVKEDMLIFKIIISLSYFSLFIYLIFILKILTTHSRERNNVTETKSLIIIILISLVFSFVLLLSNTLCEELQVISYVAFFCISMSFIFFLIRYPDYFSNAQMASQEIRYQKSQIKSLDMGLIITRLEVLMKKEKIYCDSSLTLKKLSVQLNISASQLSELLNSHYHTNFNSFINSYRIKEVIIILNEKEDINLLQTAFDCGFNSKTTFYTAFKKITGLSPSQYSKKNSPDL